MNLEGWACGAFASVVAASADTCTPPPRPEEAGVAPSEIAPARLAALGPRVADELRGAWSRATYRPDPADDQVRAMWTRWGERAPFGDQLRWQRLLEGPVVGAFRQALAARPLPPDVVARAIGDLRDALFYQLIGGREAQSTGFSELASHVLETAPGGPVAPLVAALSPAARSTVASCMSKRGHWPRTVELALPDLAGARERSLRLQGEGDPEGWIDLHTVLRLLAWWGDDPSDPERDWTIVLQNHGRSRGRLRAVAAREPPARLAAQLAPLPSLAERTRAAARRWAWAWAWESLARGFAFDLDQPVIRPCRAEPGLDPLDPDDLAMVEGWLLLVILRGRGETARRWSRDGSGDSDGTWGRLLLEVPAGLRDPDGGLSRVRAALAERWEQMVRDLGPTLTAIAAAPTGRDAKRAFWEVAGPVWHPAVGRPKAGFPTFARSAAEWIGSAR
ncbi:MAG: hypothetical protein ABMA64_04535 [Myxococcota bacterium]